ncbi:hypothetical protein MTR67_017746 [Solanum verrucosum]|uniref:Uncharacterized protein n=1 Tax=Solanum verrucosum TaxID=315347 RepID=A0AAF0QJF5_SOLVR|nr:hypothetical protein MTR67_017746 [Solanum verrucosum]
MVHRPVHGSYPTKKGGPREPSRAVDHPTSHGKARVVVLMKGRGRVFRPEPTYPSPSEEPRRPSWSVVLHMGRGSVHELSGLWREIQLRTNSSITLPYSSQPVCCHDTLFFLRSDGSVLALNTKNMSDSDIWLGSAQGLPTLVRMAILRPPKKYHDLYKYDTQINVYKNVAVLDTADYPMYCFHPTLACVHKTPSNYVTTAQHAYIDEKLDDIRRFIIKDTSEEEVGGGGGGEEEEEEETL